METLLALQAMLAHGGGKDGLQYTLMPFFFPAVFVFFLYYFIKKTTRAEMERNEKRRY